LDSTAGLCSPRAARLTLQGSRATGVSRGTGHSASGSIVSCPGSNGISSRSSRSTTVHVRACVYIDVEARAAGARVASAGGSNISAGSRAVRGRAGAGGVTVAAWLVYADEVCRQVAGFAITGKASAWCDDIDTVAVVTTSIRRNATGIDICAGAVVVVPAHVAIARIADRGPDRIHAVTVATRIVNTAIGVAAYVVGAGGKSPVASHRGSRGGTGHSTKV